MERRGNKRKSLENIVGERLKRIRSEMNLTGVESTAEESEQEINHKEINKRDLDNRDHIVAFKVVGSVNTENRTGIPKNLENVVKDTDEKEISIHPNIVIKQERIDRKIVARPIAATGEHMYCPIVITEDDPDLDIDADGIEMVHVPYQPPVVVNLVSSDESDTDSSDTSGESDPIDKSHVKAVNEIDDILSNTHENTRKDTTTNDVDRSSSSQNKVAVETHDVTTHGTEDKNEELNRESDKSCKQGGKSVVDLGDKTQGMEMTFDGTKLDLGHLNSELTIPEPLYVLGCKSNDNTLEFEGQARDIEAASSLADGTIDDGNCTSVSNLKEVSAKSCTRGSCESKEIIESANDKTVTNSCQDIIQCEKDNISDKHDNCIISNSDIKTDSLMNKADGKAESIFCINRNDEGCVNERRPCEDVEAKSKYLNEDEKNLSNGNRDSCAEIEHTTEKNISSSICDPVGEADSTILSKAEGETFKYLEETFIVLSSSESDHEELDRSTDRNKDIKNKKVLDLHHLDDTEMKSTLKGNLDINLSQSDNSYTSSEATVNGSFIIVDEDTCTDSEVEENTAARNHCDTSKVFAEKDINNQEPDIKSDYMENGCSIKACSLNTLNAEDNFGIIKEDIIVSKMPDIERTNHIKDDNEQTNTSNDKSDDVVNDSMIKDILEFNQQSTVMNDFDWGKCEETQTCVPVSRSSVTDSLNGKSSQTNANENILKSSNTINEKDELSVKSNNRIMTPITENSLIDDSKKKDCENSSCSSDSSIKYKTGSESSNDENNNEESPVADHVESLDITISEEDYELLAQEFRKNDSLDDTTVAYNSCNTTDNGKKNLEYGLEADNDKQIDSSEVIASPKSNVKQKEPTILKLPTVGNVLNKASLKPRKHGTKPSIMYSPIRYFSDSSDDEMKENLEYSYKPRDYVNEDNFPRKRNDPSLQDNLGYYENNNVDNTRQTKRCVWERLDLPKKVPVWERLNNKPSDNFTLAVTFQPSDSETEPITYQQAIKSPPFKRVVVVKPKPLQEGVHFQNNGLKNNWELCKDIMREESARMPEETVQVSSVPKTTVKELSSVRNSSTFFTGSGRQLYNGKFEPIPSFVNTNQHLKQKTGTIQSLKNQSDNWSDYEIPPMSQPFSRTETVLVPATTTEMLPTSAAAIDMLPSHFESREILANQESSTAGFTQHSSKLKHSQNYFLHAPGKPIPVRAHSPRTCKPSKFHFLPSAQTFAQSSLHAVIPEKTEIKPQETDAISQKNDAKPQKTDAISQKNNAKPQKNDAKSQKTDAISHKTDVKPQTTDALSQKSDVKLQKNDVKPQTTDAISQKNDVKPQTTDAISQKNDVKPQKTDAIPQNNAVIQEQTDVKVNNKNKTVHLKTDTLIGEFRPGTVPFQEKIKWHSFLKCEQCGHECKREETMTAHFKHTMHRRAGRFKLENADTVIKQDNYFLNKLRPFDELVYVCPVAACEQVFLTRAECILHYQRGHWKLGRVYCTAKIQKEELCHLRCFCSMLECSVCGKLLADGLNLEHHSRSNAHQLFHQYEGTFHIFVCYGCQDFFRSFVPAVDHKCLKKNPSNIALRLLHVSKNKQEVHIE